MRGIKRKIPLKLIENKASRAVAFSKRSKGLYSKATDLCLRSGGKIAIIATPVSSKSNVSFYSFGHSSVDSVVSAFLANQRPREDDDDDDDDDLGFWWNDEGLARSENPEELRQAMNSMSQMLQHLKDLEKRRDHEDVEKKGVLHAKALDLQSSSISANFEGFNKKSEEQILAISDNNNNNDSGLTGNFDGCHQELSLDQIFDLMETDQGSSSTSAKSEGFNNSSEEHILAISDNNNKNNNSGLTANLDYIVTHQKQTLDLQSSSTSANFEGFNKNSEDQILAISDNNNSGLTATNEDWFDQELNLDDMSDFEAFVYGGSTKDEDDLHVTHQNQTLDLQSSSTSANFEGFNKKSEDQILAISDNNNNNNNSGLTANNEDWFDRELNLDDMSDFEAFVYGGSTKDEDDLHFSDFCNELASITAL